MKLLFDLLPVALFFAVFKLAGIYAATAAAIAACAAQVAWALLRRRRVDRTLWVTFGVVLALGGATLLVRDEMFIKWKPTVLYWVFAAVLLGSDLLYRKNLVAAMLGDRISLPGAAWRRLSLGWVGFFSLLGALNLFVAYRFSTDAWVNFKLFGATGLTLLFVLAQAVVLARHVEDRGEAG